MAKKKLFYELKRDGRGYVVGPTAKEIAMAVESELGDMEYTANPPNANDVITLVPIWMTQREFNKLKEFEGW